MNTGSAGQCSRGAVIQSWAGPSPAGRAGRRARCLLRYPSHGRRLAEPAHHRTSAFRPNTQDTHPTKAGRLYHLQGLYGPIWTAYPHYISARGELVSLSAIQEASTTQIAEDGS